MQKGKVEFRVRQVAAAALLTSGFVAAVFPAEAYARASLSKTS